MDFDNDFFIQAQGVIERTFRKRRGDILDAHGKIEHELKDDNTPVTVLDKEIEQDLRKALTEFNPSIGLHGEEHGKEGNEDTFWLIDPIDGTDSFVRGLPYVRNIVALIHDGECIFTMIYMPITDELYVAAKGEGAYKNGQQIHMKERPLNKALIEISMPADAPEAPKIWKAVHSKIWNYRIGNFLQIAEGSLDGHLLYKPKGEVWDYAPRALLIQEAGGKVANIGSDTYDYKNLDFLAAHPAIFDELMDTVVSAINS